MIETLANRSRYPKLFGKPFELFKAALQDAECFGQSFFGEASGRQGIARDVCAGPVRGTGKDIQRRDHFRVRTEKPRSFEQSSERLPSSELSSTTSRPHSRCI